MIATAIACSACGVALTGGIDTYGGYSLPLCFLCHTSPFDALNEQANSRMEFLRLRRENLTRRLTDAEADLSAARQDVDYLNRRLIALDNEMDGRERCTEQEENDYVRP